MKIFNLFLLALSSTDAFSPISSTVSLRTNTNTNTHLYSTAASPPSQQIADGLSKTILSKGDPSQPLRFGDIATVSYNVYTPQSKTTISKASSQKIVVGDNIMISGFELGLNSCNVGEKCIIHITDPDVHGYGQDGIVPILGPGEKLDVELMVLETEEQSKFGSSSVGIAGGDVSAVSGMTGSGELGALDPMKPRTPETIAAAYAARQEQMMFEKDNLNEKEGIEGWIEKIKEFYFFGFFEGETGEKAPWILRPSITFPIAFAFVGVGFYITFAVGGISERGAQISDELDDIVLSWNVMKDTLAVVALAMVQK